MKNEDAISMKLDECDTLQDSNWMTEIDDTTDYALELWIIRTKGDTAKHKIIYGRSFIFSFSNCKWNYSKNNNYKGIGDEGIQLLRISLYAPGEKILNVLYELSQGEDINIATRKSGLEVTSAFEKEIGTAKLIGPVISKPRYYMFNRDAAYPRKIKSPHYKTGGHCHSLSQSMKEIIFSFDGKLIHRKTNYILSELMKQVGNDFRGVNSGRIGDIEILSFPHTDSYHKSSLEVKVGQNKKSVEISFKTQASNENELYRASIKIFNSNRLIYSVLSKETQQEHGHVLISICVGEEKIELIDTLECEIFVSKDNSDEFQLITQWNMPYIREISMSSNVLGSSVVVENNWLSRGLKKETPKSRITAASLMNVKRDKPSKIVSRDNEDWVENDRRIDSLISKINPKIDKGGFFQRISHGDRLGRLEFSEWLQKTLGGVKQGHVVFFDPYFEDAGLHLFMTYLPPTVECTIFTTNPEEGSERLDNIINFSNANSSLLKMKKIEIVGMRDGKLHDRYLILIDSNGFADGGYHFSNSLQRANLNHPLLVTPIPQNTLLKVVEYCDFLFDEVDKDASVDDDKKFIDVYSSKNSQDLVKKTRNISSQLSDKPGLREFLAVWLNDVEFLTLQEQEIRERLEKSGLLEGNHFKASVKIPLEKILDMEVTKAHACWEGLSWVLASSHILEDIKSSIPRLDDVKFKVFLNYFLSGKFGDSIKHDSEVIPLALLKSNIKDLMTSSRLLEHFSHYRKDSNLTWGDYYAIKIYLEFYTEDFILFVDTHLSTLEKESNLSFIIINQCISVIATYILTNEEGFSLMPSNLHSGILNWFKLNGVLNKYISSRSPKLIQEFIYNKTLDFSILTLGWFANAIKKERRDVASIEDITSQLLLLLCNHKGEYTAEEIFNSIRGHMPRFGWNVSWGYNEYISPLIRHNLITTDEFCVVINNELMEYFNDVKKRSASFNINREGLITAIAANFLLNSSHDTQVICLSKMLSILNESKVIIQRPFESAIDWERWDSARYITIWCQTYLTFLRKLCENHKKTMIVVDELDSIIAHSFKFIGEDPDISFRKDYQVMTTLYENIHIK